MKVANCQVLPFVTFLGGLSDPEKGFFVTSISGDQKVTTGRN